MINWATGKRFVIAILLACCYFCVCSWSKMFREINCFTLTSCSFTSTSLITSCNNLASSCRSCATHSQKTPQQNSATRKTRLIIHNRFLRSSLGVRTQAPPLAALYRHPVLYAVTHYFRPIPGACHPLSRLHASEFESAGTICLEGLIYLA